MFFDALPEVVRELYEKSGKTQKQLCEGTSLDDKLLSARITGTTKFQAEDLEALLKMFNLTESELWEMCFRVQRRHYFEKADEKGWPVPSPDSSQVVHHVVKLFRHDTEKLETADREAFDSLRVGAFETAARLCVELEKAHGFYARRVAE